MKNATHHPGRRAILGAGLAMPALLAGSRAGAQAQPLKIGVLCDMSGIYADNTGPGLVAGTNLGVKEYGGSVGGRPVQVVFADDQNKPDVGSAIAGKWMDSEGVSAIVCASASSITLAVSDMAHAKNKVLLVTGSLSADLTGSRCHPTTFQFGLDTYAGPKSVIGPSIAKGLDSWFIINVDYAFGLSLRDEGRRMIEAAGGKVLGTTGFPLGNSEFSSQILQAKASGAKAIAVACGGSDWSNLVKQCHEFGVAQGGQSLVTLTGGINEIMSVGPSLAAGMAASMPWYWDLNDGSRAFNTQYRAAMNNRFPNWQQANGYSAAIHYLKAVAAAGSDDGAKVAAAMRAIKVQDKLIDGATIREDGQVMRPTYLMEVKPETKPGLADCFKLVSTLSAEQSWRPANESACPALRKA